MIRTQNEKEQPRPKWPHRTRPLTWQQKKVMLDECFKNYKKANG